MEKIVSDQLHYLHVLSQLFNELNNEDLARILNVGTVMDLLPGEYVFKQGDKENALYIVLSGRLRAVLQDEHGVRILGDAAEGEPTGEFALFTNEPRMASVLAIRKTTVLKLSQDEYLQLVAEKPLFASMLTRFLMKRMKRNMLEQHMSAVPKNIAFIKLQSEYDLSPWTDSIKDNFEQQDLPIQVFDHTDAEAGEGFDFKSLEQQEGLNILVCSDAYPQWSEQCLLYADLVIVATDFAAPATLYPIETNLRLYDQSILNKKIYLVMLHENAHQLPSNTSNWLAPRIINLHIHLRRNNAYDIRRFCRIISNQAVGVVLGGGGAKGFAHVGALRALTEAGVEIDFLGGTSAGALYGIGMTHADFDFDKVDAICGDSVRRKLTSNDYSWPLVSIMSGRKLSGFMREMFGDADLEDIWVNSYCVSTNFSTSSIAVHDKGPVSKMVQASIAIPGVFPPVVINNQLHVDGCVVDNLPVEPMYNYPVRHIIAISLSSLNTVEVDYTDMPSGRTLLWDKITRRRQFAMPGIVSLIVESLTLNSRQKQESTKAKVSLYFEMDLKDVGLLDDKKWSTTIKKGHDQMQAYLDELPEEEKFWLR